MFASSANKSLFTLNIPSLDGIAITLNTFKHTESMSHSDLFEVNLRGPDGILASDLLNQSCHITWDWDGIEQHYHGLLTGYTENADVQGYSNYTFFCESALVVLKTSRQSRHFIYKTLDVIVKEVIDTSEAKLLNTVFHLTGSNPERDFTAQHEETDLSFIERILHEKGWFYTLEHSQAGVIFHVYDHSNTLPTLPHPIYFQPLAQGTKPLESIYEIKTAKQKMLIEQISAKSDCMGMRAGYGFTLSGHPFRELNQNYIIISVTHEVDERSTTLRYKNTLLLLPASLSYQPGFEIKNCQVHVISMAQIHSEDDAPLLNDRGEYILRSPYTQELTHPVRSATLYSGSDYGLHFPLHADAQVLVAYLNGHPDKPVVLGSLFNDEHRNVVNAENHRQNLLVTQSGHTLLLDDRPAHQKILLHTPEQNHRLLLDASTGAEKIELISETGEMHIDISQSTQFKTEDHFHLSADQSIDLVAQDNVSFASDEKNMSCEAALDISHIAGQDMLWHTDKVMSIRVDGNSQTVVQQSMRTDIEQGDYSLKIAAGNLSHQVQNNIQFSTSTGDITLKTAQASVSFKADGTILFSAKNIILQAGSIDIHNAGETKEN